MFAPDIEANSMRFAEEIKGKKVYVIGDGDPVHLFRIHTANMVNLAGQ